MRSADCVPSRRRRRSRSWPCESSTSTTAHRPVALRRMSTSGHSGRPSRRSPRSGADAVPTSMHSRRGCHSRRRKRGSARRRSSVRRAPSTRSSARCDSDRPPKCWRSAWTSPRGRRGRICRRPLFRFLHCRSSAIANAVDRFYGAIFAVRLRGALPRRPHGLPQPPRPPRGQRRGHSGGGGPLALGAALLAVFSIAPLRRDVVADAGEQPQRPEAGFVPRNVPLAQRHRRCRRDERSTMAMEAMHAR